MNAPRRIVAALRAATFVAGGAFAVHELSHLAGSGAADSAAHSYLSGLLPALAILAALTLLATVEGGLAGPRARRRSPFGRILTYAAAILAVFLAQEAAESLLAGGDPAAIGTLLAHGGIVAVPLALGFGTLAWLAVRGLEAVEERIATRFAESAAPGRPRASLRPRWLDVVLEPAILAGCAAARAPPSI
jgi:uncharacterized membrane protein YgdD (TMEM256/DUF423 family)